METDKPSIGNIQAMSKVGQSKKTGLPAGQEVERSGSKSLALGPWSMSSFLVAF